ncbi:hypothetical protein J7K99_03645, partial [bacterium]|nr:hypothetical protein [bacterium]
MFRKTLWILCVILVGVAFAQYSPTITWNSPADSATLHYEDGHWVYHDPYTADTSFRCSFMTPGGVDTASLWIKISRNGEPLEEITGYYSEFGYDYGYAEGSFNSLGLEPGGVYQLCAHIGDMSGIDTVECVVFFTEDLPDHCPPIFVGWNLDPPDAPCFSGYLSFLVCDNSPDCTTQSGVDSTSLVAYVIVGGDTIDIRPHIYAYSSGGPNCMRFGFNPDIPCDSLNYILASAGDFDICVSLADNLGNRMPEPVCTTFAVCPDTCPPSEVYNPNFGTDTIIYFDGTHWHNGAGETGWTFYFNDNYSPCPPSLFNPDLIGLNIRVCGTDEWTYIPAESVDIYMEPGYCRLGGYAYGTYDALGLECGNCYEIRAQAGDVAGNVGYAYVIDTIYTYDCPPADTCPPVITWYGPYEGDTLEFDGSHWITHSPGGGTDTSFYVQISDMNCASSGLVDSSFVIILRRCDDTAWTVIEGYEYIPGWDYADAHGSLNLLGLEPGQCYEICAEIDDNAGLHGEGCITFYTEPEPTDTCPPEVYWNVPYNGDTLVFEDGVW